MICPPLTTRSGAQHMTKRRLTVLPTLLLALCSAAVARAADAPKFELHKGDHICIIGNTLAERMQHDGWLETMIQSKFPDYELVFRNLGYSGDEVRLDKRIRSLNFGTP